MNDIMDNQMIVIILAALFAVSEALSFIPALKANGIFQLIYGIIAYLVSKKK